MSVAAIELNDMGLRLATSQGLSAASPGYALFGPGEPVVGDTALAAARLEPLNVSNRFWHELDDRPLSTPAAQGRSHADLAFAHLMSLCGPARGEFERLLAVVPGSMQARQLMLLLGIAREAQLPLAGFLDAAVAATCAWGGSGRMVYVDVSLHEAVLTAVAADARVRRERMEVVPRAGWTTLVDRWMKGIAAQLVARTRFDPLHDARSEQRLFEALPGWIEELQAVPACEAQITVGEETHAFTLTREQVELEARPVYDQIALAAHRLRRAGHAMTLGLSDRAARLPGLLTRLEEFHDCEVVVYGPGAAARAALEIPVEWAVQAETAALVRSADRLGADQAGSLAPVVARGTAPAPAASKPTHALYRGKAYSIGASPLVVGTAGSAAGTNLRIVDTSAGISRVHCSLMRASDSAMVVDHSRYGTWLNDERVVGRAPLRAGDRLRLGNPGVTLELIAVD